MMKIIFNALMVLRGWFNTLACCQLLDSGFNQWLWWRWSRLKCLEDDSAFWLVVDYDSDRELLCQRGHRCGQSNSINWLLMRRVGGEWWWLIMVIMTNDDDDDIGSESEGSSCIHLTIATGRSSHWGWLSQKLVASVRSLLLICLSNSPSDHWYSSNWNGSSWKLSRS